MLDGSDARNWSRCLPNTPLTRIAVRLISSSVSSDSGCGAVLIASSLVHVPIFSLCLARAAYDVNSSTQWSTSRHSLSMGTKTSVAADSAALSVALV